MKKENGKQFEYAQKIVFKLNELFDDSETEIKIDVNDFDDDENSTAFMHALANLAPCMINNKFTGIEMDSLTFNHLANKLCFKYGQLEI